MNRFYFFLPSYAHLVKLSYYPLSNCAAKLNQITRGRVEYFVHTHLSDLAKRIQQEDEYLFKLIITDSVFNMDGDVIDLPYLIKIRQENSNVMIMLGEAHSIGVLRNSGRGIEEHFNIHPSEGEDLLMGIGYKYLCISNYSSIPNTLLFILIIVIRDLQFKPKTKSLLCKNIVSAKTFC